MKKLNLLFGLLISLSLTFTACYKEDYDPSYDDNFSDEFYDEEAGNHDHDHDADFEGEGNTSAIANYEVDGDFIIKKSSTKHAQTWMNDEAKHQFMWEHFAKMVGTDQRRWIVEFEVFDGGGDLLGYVQPINEGDLSRWKFALAIDVAYVNGEFDKDNEYTYTLIHEYAHVITLNETQINTNTSGCTTYENQEGCTYTDSYINQFQQRFWADIMEEFEIATYETHESDAFYDKYQDRFVTNYAATNPEEDLAEVFSFFVTKDAMPQGGSMADEKVRSLYDYPELVHLRNTMRQGASALPAAGTWSRAKQLKLKKFKSGKTVLRR